ncbi:MAG: hydroxymethylglutaryl-CoA synthase [Thermoanaerobaculia bacterium]|nr:hydroxymethylglutaryl-CoA synthase [Thermoanaerobaculia bacterium]
MNSQPASHATTEVGIASIGLQLPSLAFDVRDLASLRGEDPDKFTIGLGCREMALCSEDEGIVHLALGAARRALDRWDGELDDLGLLVVGTESAVDMSRPLSAWVADGLGLRGAVRSYEVKHACYGGTLALRQAVEWKLSGAAAGKAALVVAADVALYEPGDPGEPTQGAGAVAFVVDVPTIASIDVHSHAWSEPEFDFWRPVGQDFPSVDGPLSLDCYKRAAERCFRRWIEEAGDASLSKLEAVCFHVPFPKMVKKAVLALGESLGWSEEVSRAFYSEKVGPTMGWNLFTGNAYTAALWIAVARTLIGRTEGARLAAFSYGSGFGSELLTLTAGPAAIDGAWARDVETDVANRRLIDVAAYQGLRGEREVAAA